jgi:hypothetical protein
MSSEREIPDTGAKKGTGGRRGRGMKILIGFVVLLVIIIIAAILTLSVATISPRQDVTYPYTTAYAVSFPEGEPVNIGTTRFVVLSYQDEMVADVDGNREKLVIGEERRFAERRARVTTLGFPIIETNFQILMKYTGARNNRAYFDLTIQTEKQVPEFLVKRLLPAAVDAHPV